VGLSTKSLGQRGVFGKHGTRRRESANFWRREAQKMQAVAKALIEELDLAKSELTKLQKKDEEEPNP
jgi:hypothetical protein